MCPQFRSLLDVMERASHGVPSHVTPRPRGTIAGPRHVTQIMHLDHEKGPGAFIPLMWLWELRTDLHMHEACTLAGGIHTCKLPSPPKVQVTEGSTVMLLFVCIR